MQQPQKFDLNPRARDLVVEIIGRVLAINHDPLEPAGRLGICALVLFVIVLGQGHDEGRYGQGNTHIDVVHQGYYPFRPLRLDNAWVFPVQAEHR